MKFEESGREGERERERERERKREDRKMEDVYYAHWDE